MTTIGKTIVGVLGLSLVGGVGLLAWKIAGPRQPQSSTQPGEPPPADPGAVSWRGRGPLGVRSAPAGADPGAAAPGVQAMQDRPAGPGGGFMNHGRPRPTTPPFMPEGYVPDPSARPRDNQVSYARHLAQTPPQQHEQAMRAVAKQFSAVDVKQVSCDQKPCKAMVDATDPSQLDAFAREANAMYQGQMGGHVIREVQPDGSTVWHASFTIGTVAHRPPPHAPPGPHHPSGWTPQGPMSRPGAPGAPGAPSGETPSSP
jgi:hypothetical protein